MLSPSGILRYFIWSLGTGIRISERAGRLARIGLTSGFIGTKPALVFSKRYLSSKIGRWMANKHDRRWQNLRRSQRQARGLTSGSNRGSSATFFSFSREQSRLVTGLVTGHNNIVGNSI
jgi:hypothetical protein